MCEDDAEEISAQSLSRLSNKEKLQHSLCFDISTQAVKDCYVAAANDQEKARLWSVSGKGAGA